MSTSTVHTDQIIISLQPDASVRGINVYAVTTYFGDDGKPTGAALLPPRDATLADVSNLLAPALVTQQGQITSLSAQLATRTQERDGARQESAGKDATIASLQAQIDALTPKPDEFPTLTARQLRLWLIGAGLSLDQVEAQIDAIAEATARTKARVEWEYATTYHHDHPLVIQFGAALGLDQAQIDAAFRAAATL